MSFTPFDEDAYYYFGDNYRSAPVPKPQKRVEPRPADWAPKNAACPARSDPVKIMMILIFVILISITYMFMYIKISILEERVNTLLHK